uniref:Uncharacterized protein n=1 Tax=Apteryx owenii TaxID=8824 RepID=A0A8B9NZD7_APTOW
MYLKHHTRKKVCAFPLQWLDGPQAEPAQPAPCSWLSPALPPRSCRPPGDRRPPGAIGSLGFLNSLLVLVLFCRSKALRSPVSLLLRNIPPSGQTACALGTPFGFATSARRLVGCVRHGFANALFGRAKSHQSQDLSLFTSQKRD